MARSQMGQVIRFEMSLPESFASIVFVCLCVCVSVCLCVFVSVCLRTKLFLNTYACNNAIENVAVKQLSACVSLSFTIYDKQPR